MNSSESPGKILVAAGCFYEGLIIFRGEVCLEGEVRGAVQVEGKLTVVPGSKIQGPVSVDELELAGHVEGDVLARQRATLNRGATLRGTLSSPSVYVADGAEIQGPCQIGSVPDESPLAVSLA